jgi:hypothetical protein
MEPTAEEFAAISSLKRVSKKWPKSLWLFSASGSLLVMKKDKNGKKVIKKNGSVDQDYVIATIDIENDGGDF